MAVADRPASRVTQHFDERGLAFACLGYGRATGRAGVFICTSGTAVVNAWPAVVEASMDGVPMLLLTADRPPELRDTGANQTIDQQQVFGRYVRFFYRSALSRCTDPRRTGRVGDPAGGTTRLSRPRPCQLHVSGAAGRWSVAPPELAEAMPTELPTAPQWNSTVTIDGGDTLVVVGGCRAEEAAAARRLAERLDCPLLADITTGIRGLAYDLQLLRSDQPVPETIIHVGGRVVSKRWWQWLQQYPPRQWLQLIGAVVRSTRCAVARRSSKALWYPCAKDWSRSGPAAEPFATPGSEARIVRAAAQDVLRTTGGLHEPGLAQRVADCLPPDHGLLLGNSMPIRDMDSFGFWSEHRHVAVAANRGASGIDGLLGTAVGYAAGLDCPVTAVVGDLSLLHDLNSLAMVAASRRPLVVVVVNNNGGGIFHFLPIADATRTFEQFFATPHGLPLEHAATLFGLDYVRPLTWAEFEAGYRTACRSQRSTLIEVRTDRHENLRLHRRVEQAIRDARQ